MINGTAVTVAEGVTILEAAEQLQIEIPTLCHMKGSAPRTSCMLCVVKESVSGQMLPSCAAKAAEGMQIETECAEVRAARRDILNLLLSEHVGDCEAPCTRICPAHLDIPRMLREIERGNLEEAGWIARRDLAIPQILSHVCPAPCEKGCRRGPLDTSIPIRKMHDEAGKACAPWTDRRSVPTQAVAVMGSGAAGLSCAWNLLLLGAECTVFDLAAEAGGALREMEALPSEVLDAEIAWLKEAGIQFKLGAAPNAADFDAIVEPEEHKLIVKAVANGKAAARSFAGKPDAAQFDSRIGKLRESELEQLSNNCSEYEDLSDLSKEAARCLHCDCRKPESCKLRKYAAQYGASAAEYPADERAHLQVIGKGNAVVFEPGKCIKCGLCIEAAAQHGEPLGLTFIGRGFNTRVTVPFDEALDAGLRTAAEACVNICPTGALAFWRR